LTFRRIAQETGRVLVILAKDRYMLDAMGLASGGPWTVEAAAEVLIYAERKGMLSAVEERIRDQYADRLITPEAVRADPGGFILCLSFFDIKHLIDINPPPGGLYIYSSSEAYEEEQEIDQWRLRNWLSRFGLRHAGFEAAEGLHASGHGSGPDLLRVVQGISPRVLVPIHTTAPEFYAGRLADTGIRVLSPQTGVSIAL
jgi:ribonuclease J